MSDSLQASQPRVTFFGLAPWLIVGVSLVLGLVILVLAVHNFAKEEKFVSHNLINRADALIWALEAGTRTWMSFQGENNLLQVLVEETIKQPGVIYLAVTDRDGNIIAYSSSAESGDEPAPTRFLPPAPAGSNAQWRLTTQKGYSTFEVYRLFQPLQRAAQHPRHNWRGLRDGSTMANGMRHQYPQQQLKDSIVFVGLDPAPFKRALADDFRGNIIIAVILGVTGMAGFLSLFWAHHYQRSRRLLKDTRAMAEAVITSLPLGLLTSDPEHKVHIINKAALSMLGVSRKQVANTPLHLLRGLNWLDIIATLSRKERVMEKEMILTQADNGQIPISLSASEIYNEDDIFLGHLFILRDIAEMKRLQAEIKRNDRLSVLGNLAAGVAHEIRNPLSSIKGLATFLASKHQLGQAETQAATSMIAEVNRLDGVVSELLEFARPGMLTMASANINSTIENALRLAAADIKAKQINIEFVKNNSLPEIQMNQGKLTQALLNLFLNSIQAMDTGGTLTISTAVREDGINISVSDNGCGISETDQPSIFTPYFTTKPSGTGLGLAIVHQIIESHHGSIEVKSSPGHGSTFAILLPVHKGA